MIRVLKRLKPHWVERAGKNNTSYLVCSFLSTNVFMTWPCDLTVGSYWRVFYFDMRLYFVTVRYVDNINM